ncbi:MAG: hypothetical protein DU481_07765 [Nitrosomonas sp.]
MRKSRHLGITQCSIIAGCSIGWAKFPGYLASTGMSSIPAKKTLRFNENLKRKWSPGLLIHSG